MLKKVLFFSLFLPLWASLASGNRDSGEFQAKVLHITDGDTITVRSLNANKPFKIHLKAIDCPERDQTPYGTQAQQLTQALVLGRIVTIQVYYQNGQWLHDVIFEESRSLNQALLKAGLAWWNVKNSDDEQLATLELMAKSMKRGLWQDTNPISPWDFRKTKGEGSRGKRPRANGSPNGR